MLNAVGKGFFFCEVHYVVAVKMFMWQLVKVLVCTSLNWSFMYFDHWLLFIQQLDLIFRDVHEVKLYTFPSYRLVVHVAMSGTTDKLQDWTDTNVLINLICVYFLLDHTERLNLLK